MSKKYSYYIKIFIYKYILKKRIMDLKVQYYRDIGIKIGEDVQLFSRLESNEPYLLELGNHITISSGVKFINHDNSIGRIFEEYNNLFGRIKIGDYCFIGMNSIVLPGVELAENTIVGAGSVVTKSVLEPGCIIAGNPAKKIGNVEEFKKKYEKYAFATVPETQQENIINNQHKLLIK